MRFIAKICVNSLWGKFTQNLIYRETKYVTTKSELVNIILDERYENFDMATINEDLVQVQYNKKTDVFITDKSGSTNVLIGIFTTCWARCTLYGKAIQYGKNELYCDSDSLMIVHNEKLKTESNLYVWDLDKK